MSIRTVHALLILAVIGVPTMTAAQNSPGLPFQEGDVFPEIRLPSLKDGSPMSVADFRGQKLVLHIFASW